MTSLPEFRKQYPQYDDVGDQDLASSLHSKYYSDMPQDKFYDSIGFEAGGKDDRWEITKGLLGGTFGTNPMMFGNATEVFGHLAGSEDLVGFGKNVQGYGEEQLSQYQGKVGSVADIRTDSIGNFIDDTADYASYGFGQGVSSMAPSLVAGGAVGLITANPFIGIAAGAAGPSYIQNVGDVYGGLKEEMAAQLESGEISYEDVSKAAAIAGVPMAALDLVGVGKVLGTFKGGRDAVKRALISRVARGLATGFTVEGVTEGLQEVISQFTQSEMSGADFATQERFIKIIDNAIIGGLAGGGFGAAGGAIAGDGQPAPKPPPKPEDVSRETKPVTDGDVPPPPPGFEVDPDTGIAVPAAAAPVAAEDVPAPIAQEEAAVAPVAPETVVEPVTVAPPVEAAPEPVTIAPQEIEQAVAEVETQPSEAQKEAGNYKKGHVKVQGLDIAIETPLGAERTGTDPDGETWSVVMPSHYGYVKRTEGADGEQVDVYLGDNPDSRTVFIVDQVDLDTGKFDEHKAMIGFASPDEALATYEMAFNDGRGAERAGSMTRMSIDEFKGWLSEGNTKKPVGEITEVSSAGPAAVPATSDTAAPAPGLRPSGDVGVANLVDEAAVEKTSEADMTAALAGSKNLDRYVEAKKANPDAIVMYRTGDFLEAMFEDAEIVSDVLGITLMKRENGNRTGNFPMAGFPVHSAPQYIKELEDAGHKVVEFNPKEALAVEPAPADILGPEDKAAVAPTFTPKFVEKTDKVIGEIKKILRAIAPNAQLRTVDTLWRDAGKTTQVRGAYNWMMDLVTVSLGYGDPVNTIRHEAVHSLKAMGMFTDSEWSTLEREAERTWRAQHSTDTRYPDLAGNEVALNEEAVSDAFADWRAGKQFAPGFRRIFQRIEAFLKWLGNALRGMGFRTVDDIFEKVERGEVGRRAGGPVQGEGVKYAMSDEQSTALESIRGKIGADEPTMWQRLKDVIVNRPIERIKQAMFDDLHGLKLLEMSANAGKLYEDARSAYKLARLSRGIGDVIFDSMYYGAPIWKEGTTSIDTSVKSPMQIIDDLGDRLGDFEIYIAMRRAQELRQSSEQHPEGRENLFTDAEIAAGLALGDANTDFTSRFDDLQAYNKRILDFAQQSGLLGEETRSFFDEMHKNYVPFFRIMEGGDTKSPKARLGFSGQHPNFQKLRGGTANIDHPLLNVEANIHRLIEASVKNVVMLRTQQLNAELGNIFMEPVARGVEQAAVTNAQMIRDLEKQGLEITAEDGIDTDAIRTLWSLGNKPRGDNIVSLVRAGKVEFYEVTDPMLFRSLTMIHRTQIPFIQPFRMAKHLLTAAVGLDPSFQIANFLRDTMHASVISHIGFKPVIGSLRGFKSRMTKDADWRTFLQSGAGMSSLFEADRPTMHRVVETRIRKGHKPLGKILDSPRGFIGALEHMESTFEYSTRVGAFKKLRAEGAGLMEAAYQAREISTDFALKGDWIVMRLLAETVPFLNAGVQGLYRTARGGAENPVAFTIKGGIVAAASIALYLINRDDERFKELPPYQRDTYWHFWVGDQHYKIPKPFEVGAIFGSIPERMVEAAIDEERSDEFLERMQWIFSEMFRLSVVPQLAQPPMRVYSNWDDFRERPVIPPWLENVQPEEQFDTSTPLTAVEAGRLTGQSPKKIQTLVDGYLGAWGGYLFSMADAAIRVVGDYPDAPATYLPERPVFRRLMGRKVPRSTYYTDQFYEMKREVDKTYASIQMLLGNGEVDRARTMLREHKGKLAVRDSLIKINTQLTKINRTIRALRISRTLTAKEKRERIDELYIVKNKLTKAAFRLKPLFDKRTK